MAGIYPACAAQRRTIGASRLRLLSRMATGAWSSLQTTLTMRGCCVRGCVGGRLTTCLRSKQPLMPHHSRARTQPSSSWGRRTRRPHAACRVPSTACTPSTERCLRSTASPRWMSMLPMITVRVPDLRAPSCQPSSIRLRVPAPEPASADALDGWLISMAGCLGCLVEAACPSNHLRRVI